MRYNSYNNNISFPQKKEATSLKIKSAKNARQFFQTNLFFADKSLGIFLVHQDKEKHHKSKKGMVISMFSIDSMSRTPIYEQIIDQLESFILTGALNPGDRIPSVRSLSLELSVTPVTILKAFTELDGRGLIRSVPGKGYFVCEDARDALSERKRALLDEISSLSAELSMAGIPIDEVIARIRQSYGNK